MAELLAQEWPCCTTGVRDTHGFLCVLFVQRARSRLPGVENVQVSIAHEEVLVRYDLTLQNSQRVCNTLTNLGYTLREPDRPAVLKKEGRELSRPAASPSAKAPGSPRSRC